MQKIMKRVLKLILFIYPSNIIKILSHLNSVTRTRTQELIEVIAKNGFDNYLELGVWQGENLFPIAKKFPNLKCYGVDPYLGSSFDEYYKGEIMARVNSEYFDNLHDQILNKINSYQNITLIRKTSKEAAKYFEDEALDIVFIDARHDYDYVVEDIKLWLPKVKKGGILCGHDYSLKYFGVVEAVNLLIGYDNVFIKSDTTWFYIKR